MVKFKEGRNKSLEGARKKGDNEFYTKLYTVETFMSKYEDAGLLSNKSIICNCNDGTWSAFYQYFSDRFDRLKLKKLIGIEFPQGRAAIKVKDDQDPLFIELGGDGSFDSPEVLKLMEDEGCDLIATNPPYSKIRQFYDTIRDLGIQFMFIGPVHIPCRRQMLEDILANKLFVRSGAFNKFQDKDGVEAVGGASYWYTNIPVDLRSERDKHLQTTSTYKGNEDLYPTYVDRDDIIFVKNLKMFPVDYKGKFAVPITYVEKIDRDRYELLGYTSFGTFKSMEVNEVDGQMNISNNVVRRTELVHYVPKVFNKKDGSRPASLFGNPETGEIYKSTFARMIIRKRA